MRLPTIVALCGALAILVAGCATTSGPVDLNPSQSAKPPMPYGVKIGEQALKGVPQPADCKDPTASLKPDPGAVRGDAIAAIKKRGVLRVGVDNNTYLFGFRDPKTGLLQGFDIGLAREIARNIFGDARKVQFVEFDYDARIDVLRQKDVDMVIRTMTITCARSAEVAFSTPYFRANQRVLVPSDSLANGIADLGGKRVCAASKSVALQRIALAKSHPIPVAASRWADCLVLLQQHEVDAISAGDPILTGMLQQDPKTKMVGPTIATDLYGVAMPKGEPDLVRYVNGVLESMRGNRKWNGLYQKWLAGKLKPDRGMPPASYKG